MQQSNVNTSMSLKEWGLLVTLAILWGASFFFASVAVRELPSFSVVFLRVSLGAVVLLTVLRVMNIAMPRDRTVWSAFFIMGLINNAIPFSFLVWGQTHIPGGLASILNATTPMFTVIVAHVLTADEKITLPRIGGVAAGAIGVAAMIGGDILNILDVSVLAQIACIIAPVSYAFAAVYGRKFRELGVAPMATATGQVSASTILLLPIVLVVDQPWTLAMPSSATIGAILGLAVLATSLAYIIYFKILQTTGSTNLMLVTFLVPVSAILLGVFILDEVLEQRHFVGMVLIALGLALIDGRLLNRLRR